MTRKSILLALIGLSLLAAIEAPEKPIVINLNIKIEHEIRLKVEKDVEELLKKDKDLF